MLTVTLNQEFTARKHGIQPLRDHAPKRSNASQRTNSPRSPSCQATEQPTATAQDRKQRDRATNRNRTAKQRRKQNATEQRNSVAETASKRRRAGACFHRVAFFDAQNDRSRAFPASLRHVSVAYCGDTQHLHAGLSRSRVADAGTEQRARDSPKRAKQGARPTPG